jgi:hypothetical protein
LPTSNAATLPVVPTVTCAQCGARWNAKSLTVQEGRCGDCWAPFVVPEPAPFRKYTFTVEITAPVADEDGNGYTEAEVKALLKQTLHYYAAPLNKERRAVAVDWELRESAPVSELPAER